MAVKREVTSGGKVVLRHTSGAKKGELAGSVATDAPTVPFLPPVLPTQEVAGTSEHPIAEAYAKFLGATETTPEVAPVPLSTWVHDLPDADTEAHKVAMMLAGVLPTGLDGAQHANVMGTLSRTVKTYDDLEAPTEAEWAEHLALLRAKITDPANGLTDEQRTEALAMLASAAEAGVPDARTWAFMKKADKRVWRAKYALDGQALQAGSWIDADGTEVAANVKAFREEYYAKVTAGEEPDNDVPAKYAKAFRGLTDGTPRDPATVYAFYQAENPELYLNPNKQTKYVALDLETTGKSPHDSHIIEFGMVEYDAKGNVVGRWSQFIRPPVGEDGVLSTGDEEVMAVHNIKPEDVADAPSFLEVLPLIQQRLAGATIIGHNLGFDTKFLRMSMKQYAASDPELNTPTWTGEADTMFHAARHLVGPENNKLVTVSGFLGIPYTNGHRAEHDAEVSGEVFFKLRKALKSRQRAAIRAARADSE